MMRVPPGVPGLPEGSRTGGRCDRIVSLLDLFPTLTSLCGLDPKPGLEGRDLSPLLVNPNQGWDYPAVTTYDFNEFSIRTEGWHYIHYIDDSEELYDLRADPEEWRNLAGDPEYRGVRNRLAGLMPRDPAQVVDTSYPLAPHHIPPLKSKEEYLAQKGLT
jgi:arylsulfatase A-like enzyme